MRHMLCGMCCFFFHLAMTDCRIKLYKPYRSSNPRPRSRCVFSTNNAEGCDRCLLQGRPCTWTENERLYDSADRYYVAQHPLWETIEDIPAPRFSQVGEMGEVFDAEVDGEDAEVEAEQDVEEEILGEQDLEG